MKDIDNGDWCLLVPRSSELQDRQALAVLGELGWGLGDFLSLESKFRCL